MKSDDQKQKPCYWRVYRDNRCGGVGHLAKHHHQQLKEEGNLTFRPGGGKGGKSKGRSFGKPKGRGKGVRTILRPKPKSKGRGKSGRRIQVIVNANGVEEEYEEFHYDEDWNEVEDPPEEQATIMEIHDAEEWYDFEDEEEMNRELYMKQL